MIINRVLDNGLRVVMEDLPYVKSVSLGIWVKAGSVDENSANLGISHLIEHMMFKGTEQRSAKKIAEDVDRIGGYMNAFTGKEATCYYIKVLEGNLDKACDILTDMFMNSIYDEEELAKEKNVIFEEIKMIEDSPEEYVSDILTEMVFRGSTLEKQIIGTRESLSGINRNAILDYIDRKYNTENIVISVAGNFRADYVCDLFNKKLKINKGIDNRPGIRQLPYIPEYQVKVKDVEQSHICLGVRGVPQEDKLYYPMILLNSIIGGSMSSRLFQNIREQKGLAYSVYSSSSSYVYDGIYSIYAGVSHSKIDATIEAIGDEMNIISSKGIDSEELSIAREQLKSSYVFGQENVNSRMYANGKNTLLLSRLLSIQEILDRIDSVTMDEIRLASSAITDMGKYSAAIISNKNYDLRTKVEGLL
ncbi:pitrilysin family protein [Bacillota bacterium]